MGIRWDAAKNARLKALRGIGFEQLVESEYVALLRHPGRKHQHYLLFEVSGYIWVVPCVNRGDDLFLKTAFPSRKYTKIWRAGKLP